MAAFCWRRPQRDAYANIDLCRLIPKDHHTTNRAPWQEAVEPFNGAPVARWSLFPLASGRRSWYGKKRPLREFRLVSLTRLAPRGGRGFCPDLKVCRQKEALHLGVCG